MPKALLKSKVQSIYYKDSNEQIRKQYESTDVKRLSYSEANQLLIERGIAFSELVKVQYEVIYLELSVEEIDNYLVEATRLREPRSNQN